MLPYRSPRQFIPHSARTSTSQGPLPFYDGGNPAQAAADIEDMGDPFASRSAYKPKPSPTTGRRLSQISFFEEDRFNEDVWPGHNDCVDEFEAPSLKRARKLQQRPSVTSTPRQSQQQRRGVTSAPRQPQRGMQPLPLLVVMADPMLEAAGRRRVGTYLQLPPTPTLRALDGMPPSPDIPFRRMRLSEPLLAPVSKLRLVEQIDEDQEIDGDADDEEEDRYDDHGDIYDDGF